MEKNVYYLRSSAKFSSQLAPAPCKRLRWNLLHQNDLETVINAPGMYQRERGFSNGGFFCLVMVCVPRNAWRGKCVPVRWSKEGGKHGCSNSWAVGRLCFAVHQESHVFSAGLLVANNKVEANNKGSSSLSQAYPSSNWLASQRTFVWKFLADWSHGGLVCLFPTAIETWKSIAPYAYAQAIDTNWWMWV
jgi:hypothetical protein